MKKILMMLVILCFAASASAAWFFGGSDKKKTEDTKAAESTKTSDKTAAKQAEAALIIMNGKVISVNPPQNEIVILDSKVGYNRVFVVDPEAYKTVNIGDTIQANVKSNTNVIDSIKVTKAAKIETKPAPKKKK